MFIEIIRKLQHICGNPDTYVYVRALWEQHLPLPPKFEKALSL